MCGRFTQTADKAKLAREFNIAEKIFDSIKPRYNIAPSHPVPVLYGRQRCFDYFQWGLIPQWAKTPALGRQLINARKESISIKASFRSSFKSKRCLILADGFFEWKKEGKRSHPYYFRLKNGAPFGFAGLWSEWMSRDGSEIRTCTIITGPPNDLVGCIHNRMPVIVPPGLRDQWLNTDTYSARTLMDILTPYPDAEMEAFEVSSRVNDPACDSSDNIQHIPSIFRQNTPGFPEFR